MSTLQNSKKKRILKQAARLFRERGFPSTSMRVLAKAVDLEPSSLYSHISSKDDILEGICQGLAERFMEGIEEISKRDQSLEQAIGQIIDLHIRIASDDPVTFAVFQEEWKHLKPEPLARFKGWRKQYEERIMSLFRDRGADSPFEGIDPRMATYTLLNAVRWIHHVDGLDREKRRLQLSRTLKQLFIHSPRRPESSE